MKVSCNQQIRTAFLILFPSKPPPFSAFFGIWRQFRGRTFVCWWIRCWWRCWLLVSIAKTDYGSEISDVNDPWSHLHLHEAGVKSQLVVVIRKSQILKLYPSSWMYWPCRMEKEYHTRVSLFFRLSLDVFLTNDWNTFSSASLTCMNVEVSSPVPLVGLFRVLSVATGYTERWDKLNRRR